MERYCATSLSLSRSTRIAFGAEYTPEKNDTILANPQLPYLSRTFNHLLLNKLPITGDITLLGLPSCSKNTCNTAVNKAFFVPAVPARNQYQSYSRSNLFLFFSKNNYTIRKITIRTIHGDLVKHFNLFDFFRCHINDQKQSQFKIRNFFVVL